MDNGSKVSVIIPVYNGGKYLQRCLNSVSNQHYEQLEIIIINDGSTDNTSLICDEYVTKENRAIVISQENQGVSAARNAGLDIATGDYIYFLDADDYILTNGIKDLMSKACNTSADIVVAGYYVGDQFDKVEISPYHTNDLENYLCSILTGKNHSALWNKLFRSRLFEEVRFPEDICYMEDRAIIVSIIVRYKPKIFFMDEPVYFYFQNKSSITNSGNTKLLEQFSSHLFILNILSFADFNKKVLCSFLDGVCHSVLYILRNIKIKYFSYAVYIMRDFYSELYRLGLGRVLNIKHRVIFRLCTLPKLMIVLIVFPIRFILNIKNKLDL